MKPQLMLVIALVLVSACYSRTKPTAENEGEKDSDTDSENEMNPDAVTTDTTRNEETDTVSENSSREETSHEDDSHEDDSHGETVTETESLSDIKWVEISPGTFMMGSPEDEPDRSANEEQFEVTLTHGFEIAVTEITIGSWTARGFPLDDNLLDASEDTSPDMPLTESGIDEIEAFLDALSLENGYEPCYSSDNVFPTPYHCFGYRLPTEAEWEYAARAGTTTATYNGDPVEGSWSVVNDIARCNKSTYSKVATKEPNAFGLYDMLGNVAEITLSLGVYPSEPTVNPFSFDPDATPTQTYYAERGGSFRSERSSCRAANRGGGGDNNRWGSDNVGFRPVRTLTGSTLPVPDTDSFDPCPQMATLACPEMASNYQLSFTISASEMGDDVRFAAISDFPQSSAIGILGTRRAGESDEVFFAHVTFPDEFTTTTLPDSSDLRPVSLVYDVASYNFISLVCDTETCFLAAPLNHPIEGSEFPMMYNPQDMAATLTGVVVVGDGIISYNGNEWNEEMAPGSGGLFRAVQSKIGNEKEIAAAVGDGGRVAVGENNVWKSVDADVSEDLLDVTLTSTAESDLSHFAAVGSGGRLVAGWDEDLTSCVISETNLRIIATAESGQSPLKDVDHLIIDNTGQRLFLRKQATGYPPCTMDFISEKFLDFIFNPCIGPNNPTLLQEDAVTGQSGCGTI